MTTSTTDLLQEMLAKDTWTLEDHQAMLVGLFDVSTATDRLKKAVSEMESDAPKGGVALKLGIAQYMLCRFTEAIESLASGTDNKDRHYFTGLAYRGLMQYDGAIDAFKKSITRGVPAAVAMCRIAEAQVLLGDMKAAKTSAKKVASDSADGLYIAGLLAERGGDLDAAAEAYDAARQVQANHPEGTFRLAYMLDLHGNETEAMELYTELLSSPPVATHALMNLAVLHEDAGRYGEANGCIRRVLEVNPNHSRAKLFLKDCLASNNMYYDEDQARRIAKRNAVLDIPVTDFELSVRARNCLKKMNLFTLGDLVRTSEPDLLGYKNFGETSLQEIKDILGVKGLRLGQALEDGFDEFTPLLDTMPEEPVIDDSLASTPLAEIEFSVRARRVLESMSVVTIGDLAHKSEAELLGQKNFGQTSLNEMRQRLTEFGLRFREVDE